MTKFNFVHSYQKRGKEQHDENTKGFSNLASELKCKQPSDHVRIAKAVACMEGNGCEDKRVRRWICMSPAQQQLLKDRFPGL